MLKTFQCFPNPSAFAKIHLCIKESLAVVLVIIYSIGFINKVCSLLLLCLQINSSLCLDTFLRPFNSQLLYQLEHFMCSVCLGITSFRSSHELFAFQHKAISEFRPFILLKTTSLTPGLCFMPALWLLCYSIKLNKSLKIKQIKQKHSCLHENDLWATI